MASVKELAAALNLAGKLCLRPSGQGMASKPFQTCIWSSIIANLRATVKVKKRRVHLKAHSDCFLGSDAVDVVSTHILHCRFFEGVEIERAKVVCVCQALLDCNVFEAVGTKVFGKEKKHLEFHDSRSSLYRFLNAQNPSLEELERVLHPGIQTMFGCRTKPSIQDETGFTHSTPVKLNLPLKTLENISPSKGSMDSTLPQYLVDDVWQEQTMLRLLQLLELPLLDTLLHSVNAPQHLGNGNPDLIYTRNYLDREVLRAFRDSQKDHWLCAALDCLDFLPDQYLVQVSRELPRCAAPEVGDTEQGPCPGVGPEAQPRRPGMMQCKLLLFDTLLRYYSHPDRQPLLSPHMADIYTGVTDLLVQGRLDQALEAMQLSLKLLQQHRREELQTLLCFMTLAAHPQELPLDKEVENRLVVKRTFWRAIIHIKHLSKEKVDLLLLFMMDNLQDIFKIPGALHKLVSDKLSSIILGKQPDVTGSVFCQQVSTKTFEDAATTTNELHALLKSIHEDPMYSAKKKKRFLGQFYQGHPEMFVQFFGDSVSTML
ncbi:DEP domain-containing protein 7-like [Osmerus mordax]|uniref:DEP domain-containing protein 7-like n=1 Tax=Osmerus mordax TaxID=8014 RepID=UPI0035107BB9